MHQTYPQNAPPAYGYNNSAGGACTAPGAPNNGYDPEMGQFAQAGIAKSNLPNSDSTEGQGTFNIPGLPIQQVEKSIRMAFIRKVYSILSAQLLVTFGLVALFTFNDDVKAYVQTHPAVYIVAIVLSFGFLIALSCCPNVARNYPTNYLCLGGFTLCEGYLVGTMASYYDTDAVFMAVGITFGIFLGLTAFAWQTKIDFTKYSGVFMVLILAVIITGFIAIFIPSLRIIYAGLGAIVFSLFIIYDTQLIIGGKHRKVQFTIDDYVFAALNLYIDIVQLFMFLLQMLGSRD